MNTYLHDMLPAKVRKAIYGILGTLFTIETVLDAVGEGLIAEKPQSIAVAIAAALGFGLAFVNTDTATPEVDA